jgi:hypothetical protein
MLKAAPLKLNVGTKANIKIILIIAAENMILLNYFL